MTRKPLRIWLIVFTILIGSASDLPAQLMRDLRICTALKPEEARVLVARYQSPKSVLTLGAMEELGPEVARELAVCKGDLEFSVLKSLTPETAAELASHPGMLRLDALNTLSPETAAALAKHSAPLSLMGVHLDNNNLKPLMDHSGMLILGELFTMPEDKAQILSQHAGLLVLPKLTSFDSDLAERILAASSGKLRLEAVTAINTTELATKLAESPGLLSLRHLFEVPDHCLEVLVTQKGTLDIGLKSISQTQAEILIRHPGPLWLNSVPVLSELSAQILTSHSDKLVMSGLTSLEDPKLAEKLAANKPSYLSLNKLTSLRPDVARRLVAANCPLLLKKLASLTPELATELADHQATLDLSGIKSLTPEVARILVQHNKRLVLTGLTSVSPEVQEILASNKAIQLPTKK